MPRHTARQAPCYVLPEGRDESRPSKTVAFINYRRSKSDYRAVVEQGAHDLRWRVLGRAFAQVVIARWSWSRSPVSKADHFASSPWDVFGIP